MGKKKLALKRKRCPPSKSIRILLILVTAINRGVATTSIASKKVIEDDNVKIVDEADIHARTAVPSAIEIEGNIAPDVSTNGSRGQAEQPVQSVKEDWEDEKAIEEAALQSLVERLHDKGVKEVSRVLKVWFERMVVIELTISCIKGNRIRQALGNLISKTRHQPGYPGSSDRACSGR